MASDFRCYGACANAEMPCPACVALQVVTAERDEARRQRDELLEAVEAEQHPDLAVMDPMTARVALYGAAKRIRKELGSDAD